VHNPPQQQQQQHGAKEMICSGRKRRSSSSRRHDAATSQLTAGDGIRNDHTQTSFTLLDRPPAFFVERCGAFHIFNQTVSTWARERFASQTTAFSATARSVGFRVGGGGVHD
jgi:hypothetical protein